MENHQFEKLEPTRRSRGVIPYIVIALLALVIIILVFIFFFSPDTVNDLRNAAGLSLTQEQSKNTEDGKGVTGSQNSSEPEPIDPGSSAESDITDSNGGDLHTRLRGGVGSSGEDDGTLSEQLPCNDLADSVESFFNTLDTRDYIQDFKLDAPSSEYFPRLIQKLSDNPPIVSGETDDLFTILQNTAHFFRIIGKKNIFILKGILDRERQTFEQVLADFYQLTSQPECLQNRFNLSIQQDSLYSYAGFFLNTMGGRLYLFRRDSMSRMVVSYYAILIIEQANREGRNKYGIDIKDAIDNLIIEIESSRIRLQMRDIYLDTLYDLKVAYQ